VLAGRLDLEEMTCPQGWFVHVGNVGEGRQVGAFALGTEEGEQLRGLGAGAADLVRRAGVELRSPRVKGLNPGEADGQTMPARISA
jgi:hypothetical protein